MNVFVSHATADRRLARELQDGLERSGIEVWSDNSIRPGESLSGAIATALRRADAFVVVLTPAYGQSEWTRLETAAAIASGKPVIPILAESGADVPPLLRDVQYVDLTDRGSWSADVERLSKALQDPAWPHSRDGGIEVVGMASAALHYERLAYEEATAVRNARFWRLQFLSAVTGVLAVAAALITLTATDIAAVSAVVSGLAALLATGIGFYFGSFSERDRT